MSLRGTKQSHLGFKLDGTLPRRREGKTKTATE